MAVKDWILIIVIVSWCIGSLFLWMRQRHKNKRCCGDCSNCCGCE